MKKIAILVASLAIVFFTVPALAKSENAKGPAPKVDVCHYSEEINDYVLISISENALSAHEKHNGLHLTPPHSPCSEHYQPLLFQEESCPTGHRVRGE